MLTLQHNNINNYVVVTNDTNTLAPILE